MLKLNNLYNSNIYNFCLLCGFFIFNLFNQLALAENIKYSKYQVEIVVFKRLNYKNTIFNYGSGFSKETFYFSPLKYNKSKYVNFKDNSVKMKYLTKESNILLSERSEYKIILQEAAQYNLIPSEKNKRFLIKLGDEITHKDSLDLAQQNKEEHFIATLVITSIRNNTFNLAFNANFNTFSLNKSAKMKSNEIYYFDHPMFGALVGIFDIQENQKSL